MSRACAKNRFKCTAAAQALVALLATGSYSQGTLAAGGAADDSLTVSAADRSPRPAPTKPETVPSQEDFDQIKALLQQESAQLGELNRQLRQQEAKTQALSEQLNALSASMNLPVAATPLVVRPEAMEAVMGAASPPSPTNAAQTPQTTQQRPGTINIISPENPLSIRIGGAEFTPGGFVDLTAIFRSSDVGSGLGTNFTTIPYSNTLPLGQLSEFRFTGQGSRMTLKVDARPTKDLAVTGYYESDFNGFEPANSNISTKNNSFRLRLAFVQLRHDKWELVTGQTWSFLTPTRQGLSPYPENVFTALRLDTSYLAGLIYSRQPEIRFVYHPTSAWAVGVALENPQQFVPSSVVFPTDGSTNFFSQQFDNGSSSTNAASAASNPTVPNLHPDIEARASFDWHPGGKLFHVDAGGVARSFKVLDNLGGSLETHTITGAGGGLNSNVEIFKNFHLIENAFYGDGVGRYIGGLGPDVIVKPDGNLSAVHAGSAIGGFEWQTSPKLTVDGYFSGAYFWRNFETTTSALGSACNVGAGSFCVGFGYPGSSNAANRDYQEASVGFIPTIWSSPNYGRLQFVSQFSYVVRTPWSVAPGSPKNAHIFISYVNLRYILP